MRGRGAFVRNERATVIRRGILCQLVLPGGRTTIPEFVYFWQYLHELLSLLSGPRCGLLVVIRICLYVNLTGLRHYPLAEVHLIRQCELLAQILILFWLQLERAKLRELLLLVHHQGRLNRVCAEPIRNLA